MRPLERNGAAGLARRSRLPQTKQYPIRQASQELLRSNETAIINGSGTMIAAQTQI
jgi:hypothetical protein